jgi:hypothetical protein
MTSKSHALTELLPLLGSNQDSPDPEALPSGLLAGMWANISARIAPENRRRTHRFTHRFSLYLHVIRRPDWSKCQHDHPWSFITIILKGGYIEVVGEHTHIRRPGYIGYRPRRFEHAITKLLKGKAVTLVLRGPNHEEWGFRTRFGEKVPWQRYVKSTSWARVFWCDDRPEHVN